MLFMNSHSRYLSPNSQAGNGAGTADAAGVEGSDAQPAENADKDEGQSPSFTQADLDRILADRLSRQEKKLKREYETAAEKQTEAELADAAEWQTLAEKRQKQITALENRLAELDKQAETADKYGAALSTYVDKLSANVPPEITALLANMDAADRLSWLTSNAEKFAKATTEQPEAENGAAKRPLPSTPPPNSSAKMTPEERRKKSARTW